MKRPNVFSQGLLASKMGEFLSSCLHLMLLALGTSVFSTQGPVRGCDGYCADVHTLGLDFERQILNLTSHYVAYRTIALSSYAQANHSNHDYIYYLSIGDVYH